ncbi:MAG: hypothetical protein KA270_05955 [Saprospiraceae bacterium]|nr:hypothetical protein [Saprospiraceae bacterium]MBP6566694.1 hypothetical protein [Saprospiraceae bacterium]
MIDPKQIEKILQDHPRHFRRLVILLGFIELCKSQKKFDFEQIVERYELEPGYFRTLVDEVIKGSSFFEYTNPGCQNDSCGNLQL